MGAALNGVEKAETGKFVMRLSAIEGHRLWAPIYDSGPNPLVALERRTIRNLVKSLRPSTVIDVACGTGQWLLYFQRVGSNVFGCDVCQEMLRQGTNLTSLRGRLALADAECIPFRSSAADLVLCSLSLAYFQDIGRVFDEFARILKSRGGVLAVSDLHPEAVLAGWKRSFSRGQERYEIAHHSRAIQDVEHAAASAGLKHKFSQTTYFGMSELPIFQRAGREEQFWKMRSIPALFIGLWEKVW
jgi:ubiquinone/menaquinone biosynthesis C-methylase UbiE